MHARQRYATSVMKPRISGSFVAMAVVAVFGVSGCASDTATPAASGSQVADPVVVNSESKGSSSSNPQSLPPVGSDFDLDIDDQRGDGTFVTIESINSPDSEVYVVITDRSGQVLGAAKSTSDRQLVTVPLDPRVAQSQELYGSLYLDNGDGAFSLTTDQQVFDDENELVEEDFDYLVVDSGNGTAETP